MRRKNMRCGKGIGQDRGRGQGNGQGDRGQSGLRLRNGSCMRKDKPRQNISQISEEK